MILSILIWIAEKLGWVAVSAFLKLKQAKPVVDPTPVAQARELGQDQAKLQTTEQADAQVSTVTAAGVKSDVAAVRDPDASLRDDPFNTDR